jgi:predicted dehydrogenase
MHQAALMCRKRGRIVLVGVTGLALSRADFYEKELTFQVSCSYGPGRYDPSYEDKGVDYPIGFVRWTEQRNFEAVLDLMASGALDVKPLVSHRFTIAEAASAYELVGGSEPSLGILLEYPGFEITAASRTVQIAEPAARARDSVSVGFIGAGNYVTAMLLPAFNAAGARLRTIASSGGVTSLHAGRKFGVEQTTTDVDSILSNPEIDAVVVATRHDSHAEFVCRAIAAGKHVFVEKPLAVSHEQLERIRGAIAGAAGSRSPLLMVGFNRRFAPHVLKMRALLAGVPGPKTFVMTVNAGQIPREHWTQDAQVGGGRLIGEGCHFIDLLRFLADAPIGSHATTRMESPSADTATITLQFADGSLGTVHYFANGSKSFPKERLEVFAGGRVLQLDNFRRLTGFGWPGFKSMKAWRQDKGQRDCAAAFIAAIRDGAGSPIPLEQLFEVGRVTIDVDASG